MSHNDVVRPNSIECATLAIPTARNGLHRVSLGELGLFMVDDLSNYSITSLDEERMETVQVSKLLKETEREPLLAFLSKLMCLLLTTRQIFLRQRLKPTNGARLPSQLPDSTPSSAVLCSPILSADSYLTTISLR